MSNKPLATTPILPAEPAAPDYAVPSPQEAWERFDRLVGKVLAPPKRITADEDNQSIETNPVKKQ